MTSPYVTSAPSTARRVVRAGLAVIVLIAAAVGAVIAAFFALVVWSGCFIGCTGENHAGGFLLALLSVASLASGPAAVSGLYRSAAWMWGALWAVVLGAVAAAMVLGASA